MLGVSIPKGVQLKPKDLDQGAAQQLMGRARRALSELDTNAASGASRPKPQPKGDDAKKRKPSPSAPRPARQQPPANPKPRRPQTPPPPAPTQVYKR
jgi:hypothetical protein